MTQALIFRYHSGMAHLALYTRISQDKTGAGLSVANQLASIRAWADKHGHTLGTEYSDNDISATSGKVRPDFERLLSDAPKEVVVWHQDRLLRVSRDLEKVLDAGMIVHQVQAGSLDLATPQGKAVARTVSAWSTYEVEQKQARQKLRSAADAQAGKWHYARPVFGNDFRTGDIIPVEAEAIRKAAEALAAEQTSFYKVSKEWNAQGFRTPKSKNAGGKEWEPGTVRNFFTSPRLIGKRTYDGVSRKMEGWTPVLDEQVWKDIQGLIGSQKTGKRGVSLRASNMHLLTGIARCAECGKGMNISYRGGPNSPRYYKCTTPGHTGRTADPLERYVVGTFLYQLLHDGAEKALGPESAGNIPEVRARKRMLEAEHEAWIDEAAEEGVSPRIIAKKEAAHANKLAVLDAQILEHQKTNLFTDLFPEIAEHGIDVMWTRWDSVERVKQRAIVEALIESVTVLRAPQGTRFSGKYVVIRATPLFLRVIDAIEAGVHEITEGEFTELMGQELSI